MRFSTSGFFMNLQYLSPRVTPKNNFENIYIFAEIFAKFRVTRPGNWPISGYCHPEIDQFPGNNTRKSAESLNKKHYKTLKNRKYFTFHNCQVSSPGNRPISGYC